MISQKTKILLSICIATYNRARYIGETLESIIPQLTDEVEIVIVDGASTDNTSSVIKSYNESCKQIRYIRLSSKGGVDQDYCKAVEYAQGQMCWLFTDDDLLMPNAIGTVLAEAVNNYSLIVVNSRVTNKDFSKVLANKLLYINANEIYNESKFEQLFRRVIPYMSFIGCVVVNRSLWLEREKKSYFGTEFIHVGVTFQSPLPAPALVIAQPYITSRFGNAQWAPRAFEIWMFKWPKLIWSFKHIPEKLRQEHQMTNSWQTLIKIILFRAKGEYALKDYLKWYKEKDSSFVWRMGAFIIAIIPSIFMNLVLLSYCKILRRKALIAICEFENNKNNIFRIIGLGKNSKILPGGINLRNE